MSGFAERTKPSINLTLFEEQVFGIELRSADTTSGNLLLDHLMYPTESYTRCLANLEGLNKLNIVLLLMSNFVKGE